jgi:predicted DNA-binding protein with PD1-like motif
MNVAESKRTRTLVIHVERGEELPVALIRALHAVEAKAAAITETGIVEAIEVVGIDAKGQSCPRRIDTPALVVSLSGNVAVEDGATNVHLYATLSRETTLGNETFAGHVRWARASALDLVITVFDDLVLERLTDEQGFSSTLQATVRAPSASSASSAPSAPVRAAVQETPREVVAMPVATTAATAAAPIVKPAVKEAEIDLKLQPSAPALAHPARLHIPHEDATEVYPEVADIVTHFSFGECEVISSDGERIRLRQIKDGRVREVSLAMLKIEGPTTDPATDKRSFKLSRKN